MSRTFVMSFECTVFSVLNKGGFQRVSVIFCLLRCDVGRNGAEGGGVLGAGVEARKRLVVERAVNSQHGAVVEGSSHPCTEGCHLKYRFSFFYLLIIHCIPTYYMLGCYSYFSPLQVKNTS
jgi:hypothetical protein